MALWVFAERLDREGKRRDGKRRPSFYCGWVFPFFGSGWKEPLRPRWNDPLPPFWNEPLLVRSNEPLLLRWKEPLLAAFPSPMYWASFAAGPDSSSGDMAALVEAEAPA
jgi:hypothetical protein